MGLLSDVGNAVSSVASEVGDTVEEAGKKVVDGVENAVDSSVDAVQRGVGAATEWACKNAGGAVCGAANVVGGVVDGALEGVQDVLDGAFDVARDAFGVVGSALSLDLPGLLEDLGQLALDLVEVGVALGRLVTGGYVVGGVVEKFKRSSLIRFVDDLVEEEYDDPEERAAVREAIGLEGGRFGLRLPASHRVFVLDSADVELWRLHEEGVVDLYAMAGLLSFDSFSLGSDHPNAVVSLVDEAGHDTGRSVTRWTIAKHVETEGERNRLRVYPMSHRTAVERVETATEKLDQMGVVLHWNEGRRYPGFREETRQSVTGEEYEYDTDEFPSLLDGAPHGSPRHDDCRLHAVAGFTFEERFGLTVGVDLAGCEDFPLGAGPIVPERTDRCDARADAKAASGVVYRDVYPSNVFRYVLPHEIGHYFGLCHCGHAGVQNVMFRIGENRGLDPGLLDFYWDSEPHFTLEDGKNAWRFIVHEMSDCIE